VHFLGKCGYLKFITLYVTFFANIGPTYVTFVPLPSVQLYIAII